MNGLLRIGLGGLLIATLGCGSTCAQTQRIAIDGSTGVMPLAAALAKAFEERNPATKVEMGTGLGTKARIAALSEGRINIALTSHGLDDRGRAEPGADSCALAGRHRTYAGGDRPQGVSARAPVVSRGEEFSTSGGRALCRVRARLGGCDRDLRERSDPRQVRALGITGPFSRCRTDLPTFSRCAWIRAISALK